MRERLVWLKLSHAVLLDLNKCPSKTTQKQKGLAYSYSDKDVIVMSSSYHLGLFFAAALLCIYVTSENTLIYLYTLLSCVEAVNIIRFTNSKF